MKRTGLTTALLVVFLLLQTFSLTFAWEGTHRYSFGMQGAMTSINFLDASSQSFPIEMRGSMSITVDPPSQTGVYTGRIRLTDVQVRGAEGMVSVPVSPIGYRFRWQPPAAPEVIDSAADLEAHGLQLAELLALVFTVRSGQELREGASWNNDYTQVIEVAGQPVTLHVANSFAVNELRNDIAVVQNTQHGSVRASLAPGTIRTEILGSGFLHTDRSSGYVLRGAVTVQSIIDLEIPAGALLPEERSSLTTLLTTSIERLPATEPAKLPALGAEYRDPAQRFSLRLPEGWTPTPVLLDRSLTVFSSPDHRSFLYIDLAPSSDSAGPIDLANTMLAHYERYLIDFSLLTKPQEAVLGGHPAALVEYRYREDGEVTEGALYSTVGDYAVALQLSMDPLQYTAQGPHLLQALAEHFALGPHPEGKVTANDLLMAPSVLYESDDLAFEIYVPNLWPYVETGDGSVRFTELGGAGWLNIHVESVHPEESSLTLLEQWVRRIEAEQPEIEIVSPPTLAGLGPLSGAAMTFRWNDGDVSRTQKVTVANWNGVLYVVAIDYETEGFEERAAVFDRITSGFRPLPEQALKNVLVFDAYNPPPAPGESGHLLIGRVLHEYTDDGDVYTLPAADARIDVIVGGERFTARTDADGFFYMANLPARPGDEMYVEQIRGRFFNLPFDINIPIDGLAIAASGPVGLFGELTLVLLPSQTEIGLRMESGADPTTGVSRVHQFFLNRFPDSPWAELVRQDLQARIAEAQ